MDAAPPGTRSRHAVAGLATFGLAGVLVNAAVLLAAPLLRPEVGLVEGGLSEYAIGPWAWLQNVGFFALGVGSFAIAVALSLGTTTSSWLPIGTALLALAASACLALAAFPMGGLGPTTLLGDAHQTAGTLAVGLQMASLLATTLAFRSDPEWRPLAAMGPRLFAIALGGAFLSQAELLWPALPIPFGVVMRMVVVPVLIWWTVVAIRLRADSA